MLWFSKRKVVVFIRYCFSLKYGKKGFHLTGLDSLLTLICIYQSKPVRLGPSRILFTFANPFSHTTRFQNPSGWRPASALLADRARRTVMAESDSTCMPYDEDEWPGAWHWWKTAGCCLYNLLTVISICGTGLSYSKYYDNSRHGMQGAIDSRLAFRLNNLAYTHIKLTSKFPSKDRLSLFGLINPVLLPLFGI